MNDIIKQNQMTLREDRLRRYMAAAMSENTRLAYRSDLRHFTNWGGSVPCSPEMLAAYLTDFAETLSMATLSRRVPLQK